MTDAGDVLAPGTRLGELEIERALGAGGFGVTYLAMDTQLGRRVAVKEYKPLGAAEIERVTGITYVRLCGPGGKSLEVKASDYAWGEAHFLNEARTLARLHHRNLVHGHRVIDGVVDGRRIICSVMEYVEGWTLAEELQGGPLPESRVREILAALADGLQYVHAAWLLHSDVKPSNVILRSDGTPVLIDFGAARQAMAWRSIDDAQQSVLPIASVLTPGYAPIEQYNPRLKQGPWTDIYALGAVAYEALSGCRPDPAPNRMWTERFPPVVEAASQPVGLALAAAVDEALLMDPEARPQSLHEWRRRLDGVASRGAGTAVVERASCNDAAVSSELSTSPGNDGRSSNDGVLVPGTRLEDLSIERVLGRGSYSVTYLAHDARLGCQVTVQQYLPPDSVARASDTFGLTFSLRGSAPGEDRLVGGRVSYMLGLTHFLNEGRMLERLDHPNVVRVHRVFRVGNTAYRVMEYVEGRSLAEELRTGGALREERLRRILGPLTDGLMVVHAAGMLHWDVQPANVMLRARDGEPVLVDFAAVKQAMDWRHVYEGAEDPERWPPKMPLMRLGSVRVPDEQYNETLRRGPWTDIYGLGALSHYSLTGRSYSYWDAMKMREPQPVAEMSVHPVSKALAVAVDAALATVPEARPQSVGEWRVMLSL